MVYMWLPETTCDYSAWTFPFFKSVLDLSTGNHIEISMLGANFHLWFCCLFSWLLCIISHILGDTKALIVSSDLGSPNKSTHPFGAYCTSKWLKCNLGIANFCWGGVLSCLIHSSKIWSQPWWLFNQYQVKVRWPSRPPCVIRGRRIRTCCFPKC